MSDHEIYVLLRNEEIFLFGHGGQGVGRIKALIAGCRDEAGLCCETSRFIRL
ncbi:hypothetical protein [Pseudomonas sp. TE3610]